MGVSKKWLRIVRTKFLRSSNKDITLPPRTIVCTNQTQQAIHGNEQPLILHQPHYSLRKTMQQLRFKLISGVILQDEHIEH
ncbi:iq-domain [Trifolium repens]|nr:iq-domain [Trifolium repens]